MSENKVKLPKDIAEILGSFSEWGIETLFQEIIGHNRIHPETSQITKLHEFFNGKWTFLAKSLINGYEVEMTPEDKVRDMFNTITPEGWKFTGDANDPVYIERSAIRNTCTLLGHKIDGVNT